jgi:hypothetical protein
MFRRKKQWKATNKKTKTQMEGYYLNKAQEECVRAWIGFIGLGIGASDRLLLTW